MNIAIHFSGGCRSEFGETDFEGILSNALSRFWHRLNKVSLYMEDVNGPRGGIDKHCRCVLQVRNMSPIVIQDTDENVSSLVHRVASRASHTLSRRAGRKTKRAQKVRTSRRRLLNQPLDS